MTSLCYMLSFSPGLWFQFPALASRVGWQVGGTLEEEVVSEKATAMCLHLTPPTLNVGSSCTLLSFNWLNWVFFFLFLRSQWSPVVVSQDEAMDEVCVCVLSGRQWVYQTCTEFGFYQSTDSPNQPFTGFPLPWVLCAWTVFLLPARNDLLSPSLSTLHSPFFPIFASIFIRRYIIVLDLLFQVSCKTVRRFLQHQCRAAGGGRGPDQRVLWGLWHPLHQDSFSQRLHWPLACPGNHPGHHTWPPGYFHQRWEEIMCKLCDSVLLI